MRPVVQVANGVGKTKVLVLGRRFEPVSDYIEQFAYAGRMLALSSGLIKFDW